MSPEQAFSLANLLALLAWVVLAAWPRRSRVPQMVSGAVVPGLLAAVYVAILATAWRGSSGGFSSLADVSTLFSSPWLLLAGWVHYLAFDLLVGGWEARDALERGIPQLLVLPCLALTFMFGPAGWLLYVGLRSAYRRSGARVR
jgi:ABA DEFICIENT 4-like